MLRSTNIVGSKINRFSTQSICAPFFRSAVYRKEYNNILFSLKCRLPLFSENYLQIYHANQSTAEMILASSSLIADAYLLHRGHPAVWQLFWHTWWIWFAYFVVQTCLLPELLYTMPMTEVRMRQQHIYYITCIWNLHTYYPSFSFQKLKGYRHLELYLLGKFSTITTINVKRFSHLPLQIVAKSGADNFLLMFLIPNQQQCIYIFLSWL